MPSQLRASHPPVDLHEKIVPDHPGESTTEENAVAQEQSHNETVSTLRESRLEHSGQRAPTEHPERRFLSAAPGVHQRLKSNSPSFAP